MRDAPALEEAIQSRAIGNPRHHVTVRADWPRTPSPVWPELVPILIYLAGLALAMWAW